MGFFEDREQFNAPAGQKKNTCFFGNARRVSSKTEKKHSGLMFTWDPTCENWSSRVIWKPRRGPRFSNHLGEISSRKEGLK